MITPPSSSTLGPLTILAGSQGFTASGVYDYLATTKDATTGNPLQAFGLSFYPSLSGTGGGLASLANGGVLNFSLNVADPGTPPQLVSQTPGVSISLLPADSSTGSTGSTTGTTGTTGGNGSVQRPRYTRATVGGRLVGSCWGRAATITKFAKIPPNEPRVRVMPCFEHPGRARLGENTSA